MDEIAAALTRLAPRLAPGGARVENLVRLSGGASLETWAFTVMGQGPPADLILRRRGTPLGEGATAVPLSVEAALITAAGAAGAPVAPLVHLCGPEDRLAEAYVTGRVEGEALGRRIVRDDRFAKVRPRLARQCGQILARIHGVPPPPDAGLDAYDAQGQLARYEAVYRTSGAQRPVLELAFQHLKRHAPPPVPLRLLHGDFRNGNLMIDPQEGVVAALDWELAHIGDPAEDLGWLCVNSWRFGGNAKPVGGFGDYADLLAGYRDVAGEDIPLGRILFWQALGSLKWGVMCLMMYASFAAEGLDAGVERAVIGRRVSETEIDLLNLLEAGL